jgi:hypothetical protein
MQKREDYLNNREQNLRCPVCELRIHRQLGSPQEGPLVSQAGQLTQCDRCLSILEYLLKGRCLALRPASERRINAFNQLAKETHEFNLAKLVDYVMKYRRMPVTPAQS